MAKHWIVRIGGPDDYTYREVSDVPTATAAVERAFGIITLTTVAKPITLLQLRNAKQRQEIMNDPKGWTSFQALNKYGFGHKEIPPSNEEIL